MIICRNLVSKTGKLAKHPEPQIKIHLCMITKYFSGLQSKQSDFPGFYILDYRGRSYYACAYRDRLRGKTELSSLIKSLKTFPKYQSRDFEFHHIVERLHLADISCAGSEVNTAYPAMPTVMIHKGEHHQYNMILHAGETRELYMRTAANLPSGTENSEQSVRTMLATADSKEKELAKGEIRQRIDIMNQLYHGVYENNSLLKMIASNIFSDYRSRLAAI